MVATGELNRDVVSGIGGQIRTRRDSGASARLFAKILICGDPIPHHSHSQAINVTAKFISIPKQHFDNQKAPPKIPIGNSVQESNFATILTKIWISVSSF